MGEVKVLGQRVNPAQGPFPVFPGPVDVTAAGTSLLQPATTTVEVAGDDARAWQPCPADLRPEAAAAADTAVRKALSSNRSGASWSS